MNNMANFMNRVQRFRQDVMAKYPNQSPDQIIQQMMNNGSLSQSQYEAARQQYQQFENFVKMMNPGAQG